MKQNIILSFLLLAFVSFTFLFSPSESKAASYYPGTLIQVEAGDIIYSPKSKSTFFAGHIAIVGDD
ncbi:hypothetical protein MTP04_15000 [Lysinibacillus sp. PLM2]|nr:hypothetical protein MTP04_15000 [Lysinibacillus sp. PLM2]